ncbi:MAG TPA: ribbon-helix-helix protein, CopG family [Thermoanaerobaculia bacterium]|nr:ribbon-helix-helix protein, CopG family [Thermoanaerobaculia bacterium]
MAKKVTFTLDDRTVQRIASAAERLAKPKSEVVREAVADYYERIGRLSEAERRRMISVLDGLGRSRPTRTADEVDAEIESIRTARRAGGRAAARRRS